MIKKESHNGSQNACGRNVLIRLEQVERQAGSGKSFRRDSMHTGESVKR